MKAGALAAPLAVLTACGTISNDPPPELPRPPIAAIPVDGEWSWRSESTVDGVRRVEQERWDLTSDGASVRGRCDRLVVISSTDGTPFHCNQQPRYELRTRYSLTGTVDADQLTLREVGHETVPSPCETGRRRHTSYRGTLDGAALRLEWDGGSQSLSRAGDARPAEPLPAPSRAVRGAWSWATHADARDEQEQWQLDEDQAGVITGGYERVVTDGECRTVARYQVRGLRSGKRVSVAETEVAVEPAPCDRYDGKRTLDSAEGTSYGDTLVLVWRGGRRQVLSRR